MIHQHLWTVILILMKVSLCKGGSQWVSDAAKSSPQHGLRLELLQVFFYKPEPKPGPATSLKFSDHDGGAVRALPQYRDNPTLSLTRPHLIVLVFLFFKNSNILQVHK